MSANPCEHKRVTTKRSVPSKSVCIDCRVEVEHVWVAVENPGADQ